MGYRRDMKGYCITVHCTREQGPDDPSIYTLIEELFQEQQSIKRTIATNQTSTEELDQTILRAIALIQKSIASLQTKLDDVIAEKKKPYVERGYRS